MLYQVHEMQRAAAAPVRMLAEVLHHLYSHPWLPIGYTRFGRAMAAGCDIVERTTRRYGKPVFGLHQTVVDGATVAVREEAVLTEPFCTLLHFRRDTERRDPKVLLVAPLSGHYATLLRGTVESLLPDHDVFITDWTDARMVPVAEGGFDLEDYVDYIRTFLQFLGPDLHVIAVCQPSVPVLAAVSLMAADGDSAQPRSMTLMGGPIDTRINPTKVNEVAVTRPYEWFERNVIHTVPIHYPAAGRRVYPGFLQLSGFMSMNIDRHVNANLRYFHHLMRGDGDSAEAHRAFYDEYMSVMDLTAEFYLQTIRVVFQDHALPLGRMSHRGVPVEPAAIRRTALMTVEGEKDDITGPGQTAAAHALCTGLAPEKRRHHLQPKVGHYGVFNGRRWRQEILPNVREFIRAHDRD